MSRIDKAGISLVEVVISAAILTVLMGGAVTLMGSGQDLFEQSIRNGVVDAKACRVINRIGRELGAAGLSTLTPRVPAQASSDFVRFQSVDGWSSSAPTWSDNIEIRLEHETNEVDNGLDDDADGLVDECRIMLVRGAGTPTERRVVLGSQVSEFLEGELPNGADDNGNGLIDERGLSFELSGNVLVIQITVLGRNPGGQSFARTLQTAIGLRN